MNINRKRQLIRRKLGTAQAKIVALCEDRIDGRTADIGAVIGVSTTLRAESRLIAMRPNDPMDVLDITQIGADYPLATSKRIDTLTKSFEKIPGCEVIGH